MGVLNGIIGVIPKEILGAFFMESLRIFMKEYPQELLGEAMKDLLRDSLEEF